MIATKDGSMTLYSPRYDEHYHSVLDGAYFESMKKHIEPAFSLICADELNILDICFGLGYNTLCAIDVARQKGIKKINILSPEIDEKLVCSLCNFEYPEQLRCFSDIIESIGCCGTYEDESTFIDVHFGNAREFIKTIPSKSVDIVFQDAFSPKNNKELWTFEYFADIKKLLKDKAVITTYTKSTGVRLAMIEAGFLIYEHNAKEFRGGTIATTFETDLLGVIDMDKKLKNAPDSAAFRD